MPILTVRHLTRYSYRRPVAFGEHRIMVRPLESCDQRVLSSQLIIVPEPVELRVVHDVCGNCVALARFARRAEDLSIESRVRLEHLPGRIGEGGGDLIDAATGAFAYEPEDRLILAPYTSSGSLDPERRLKRWSQAFLSQDGPADVLGALSAMTCAIRQDFRYLQRLYGPAQTPLETLRLGSGTCRDFAVLMMEAARALGLAAQFVSGYVYSPAFAGASTRVGGGHTHAWVRIYLPNCGWVEFDPTNGIVGSEGLIRVAVARDPSQAAPLVGTYDGAAEDFVGMDVDVEVEWAAERDSVRALMAA